MMFKHAIRGAALALLASATTASASFIANFHQNHVSGSSNELFIFGAEGTAGTISDIGGFSEAFVIPAGGVFSKTFSSATREMNVNGAINTRSLFVDAADPISGIALNRQSFTTDMTTLLDTEGLGTKYRILTTLGTFDRGSQMSVTATENNTLVTITPKNISGQADGVPYQVTLNKGESVFYNSGGGRDLSGTNVVADKDIAVFAGAECTQVPNGLAACDHIISQQFSTDNYDTEFLVPVTANAGADKDYIRVIADQDNTEIFVNGISQGTINAGEILTLDKVGNVKITSTKPVSVGQFMRGQDGTRTAGDPGFAIIPSTDQLLKEYAFSTPVNNPFGDNKLQIAISVADAASLKLNGAAVDTSGFTLAEGYLFGVIDIPVGYGVIKANGEFMATMSGFASFDSYLTLLATSFSPGVSPPPPPPPASAVPLPASGLLLLGGLAAIGARRRRKS